MSSAWQALQVRITVFYGALLPLEGGAGLSSVFGVEPETVEVKPREFRRSERGVLGAGNIENTINLNRIDWVWQAADDSETSVYTLGAADDVLSQFIKTVSLWLDDQSSVIRIAIGGHFGLPVSTREEGYLKLDSLIEEVALDPATSDFSYQINRPTTLDVGGGPLTMNRVEKWGCRTTRKVAFPINLGSAIPVQGDSSVLARFAAVELDFNTDASLTRSLSAPELDGLVKHFADAIRQFLANKQ